MTAESGSTPPKRLPSLRGQLMIDFVNGKPRVRAWPHPRGKAKTPEAKYRQNRFAAAQRAWKYIAPQFAQFLMEMTKGSPLLPRDILTMILFNRAYWVDRVPPYKDYPVPFRNDVSNSLDAISQRLGDTLVRREDGWVGEPYGGGGGGGSTKPWQLVDEVLDLTGLGSVDLVMPGPYTDARIWVEIAGSTGATQKRFWVATGDPPVFKMSNTSYTALNNNAGTSNSNGIINTGGGNTASRGYLFDILLAGVAGQPKVSGYPDMSVSPATSIYLNDTTDPITAIRFMFSSGSNTFTGGFARLYTR